MNISDISHYAIPLSMQEFNSRLIKCNTIQETVQLGFENLKDQSIIDLKKFITAILYPIESYSDLDRSQLFPLINKIQVFFPLKEYTEEDKKILSLFWSRIQKKINPDVDVITEKTLTYSGTVLEGIKIIKKELTLEQILPSFEEVFHISAEERLKNTFASLPDLQTDLQRAKVLHLILLFLTLEDESFRQINLETNIALQMQEKQRLYREDNQMIIRLSPSHEATVFEIPSSIEETDELALWLTLNHHFMIYENKIIFQSKNQLSNQSLQMTLNKIRKIESHTSSQRVKWLIHKIALWFEILLLIRKCFTIVKNRTVLNQELGKYISTQTINHSTIEQIISPFYYLLLNIFNKESLQVALQTDIPRDINIVYYQEYQKLIHHWTTQRFKQEALFQSVFCQLQTLIQKQKSKKTFFKFYENPIYKDDFDGLGKRLTIDIYHKPIPFFILDQQLEQESTLKIHPDIVSSNSQKKTKKLKNRKNNKNQATEEPLLSSELKREPSLVNEKEKKKPNISTAVSIEKIENTSYFLPSNLFDISIAAPFPYIYDWRVERWYHYPIGEPLPSQNFPEYQDKPIHYQEKMHFFHALSPLVDYFLNMAISAQIISRTRKKENILKVIAAEVIFKGVKYRGLIGYCIDTTDKICYHKFFSEQIDNQIILKISQKIFNENDFPTLSQAKLIFEKRTFPKPFQIGKEIINVDPIFNSITITNQQKNTEIKLFSTLV